MLDAFILSNYIKSKKNTKRLTSIENRNTEIYGAYWNTQSSPTMTRTNDAIGATTNAGVGTTKSLNTADFWNVFKDWSEVTDTYGNQFIRIPKLYIQKQYQSGYMVKKVSRFKHDSTWYLPACFYDFTNNKELDYADVGKYPASLSDDTTKLESKTGKFPLSSRNIVQMRDLAKANGAGYQQLDAHVVDLLTTLYDIEWATINSQVPMAGFTAGQWSTSHVTVVAATGANQIVIANAYADAYRVGQTIGIATSSAGGNDKASNRLITAINVYDASNKAIVFDGAPVDIAIGNIVYNLPMKNGTCDTVASTSGSPTSNSDGKQAFKWRGIESLFGNIWQFVDGININEYQSWVCRNADNYVSNLFASPYEQLGYVNANANGYPIEMGYDANLPFANLPKTLGGNSSTYYSDNYYPNSGQRVARLGGFLNNGSSAGLRFWVLNYSSASAYVSIGARLVKKAL